MNVLELKMNTNDAKAKTIRDYLTKLLRTLWMDGESFSGKRPFGNSGWEYDLYKPLIREGLVNGSMDEWGGVEDVDSDAAFKIIDKAIIKLMK